MSDQAIVPSEHIEQAILLVRGHRVLLDADLAALYGVSTSRLNEQVKRNRKRFPEDFVFQLSAEEFQNLRSQSAISSWGGRRVPPYVFTEHGAVMAASVLNTKVAIDVSVQVVRTFIRLRQMLASHQALARRLDAIEKKYDVRFLAVFDAVRKLMKADPKQRRAIGFLPDGKKPS